MKNIIATFFLSFTILSGFAQDKKEKGQSMNEMWGETTVALDALKAGRGKLFDEGNFGMFIHWGLFFASGWSVER